MGITGIGNTRALSNTFPTINNAVNQAVRNAGPKGIQSGLSSITSSFGDIAQKVSQTKMIGDTGITSLADSKMQIKPMSQQSSVPKPQINNFGPRSQANLHVGGQNVPPSPPPQPGSSAHAPSLRSGVNMATPPQPQAPTPPPPPDESRSGSSLRSQVNMHVGGQNSPPSPPPPPGSSAHAPSLRSGVNMATPPQPQAPTPPPPPDESRSGSSLRSQVNMHVGGQNSPSTPPPGQAGANVGNIRTEVNQMPARPPVPPPPPPPDDVQARSSLHGRAEAHISDSNEPKPTPAQSGANVGNIRTEVNQMPGRPYTPPPPPPDDLKAHTRAQSQANIHVGGQNMQSAAPQGAQGIEANRAKNLNIESEKIKQGPMVQEARIQRAGPDKEGPSPVKQSETVKQKLNQINKKPDLANIASQAIKKAATLAETTLERIKGGAERKLPGEKTQDSEIVKLIDKHLENLDAMKELMEKGHQRAFDMIKDIRI